MYQRSPGDDPSGGGEGHIELVVQGARQWLTGNQAGLTGSGANQ